MDSTTRKLSKKIEKETLARVRTKSDEQAIKDGCWFDVDAAHRVTDFFEKFIPQTQGVHKGKVLPLMDYQRLALETLFGWKNADGLRRHRVFTLYIPKKNGKTFLCAGICLYMLCYDGEKGSEVFSAATTFLNGKTGIFKEMTKMIADSPALKRRLQVVPSEARIYHEGSDSVYQLLNSSPSASQGVNAHFCCYDELHATGSKADLFHSLKWSGRARKQPIFAVISTAGEFDLESVAYQEFVYCKDVVEGRIVDTAYCGFIYAADEDDDLDDPAIWKKANPALAEGVWEESDFRDALNEVRHDPSRWASFKRYNFNIWVGKTKGFVDDATWQALPIVDSIPKLEECRVCFGFDGSVSNDLSALSILAWHEATDTYYVQNRTWISEAMKKQNTRERSSYVRWAAEGWLKECPGPMIDHLEVFQDILKEAERFSPDCFIADRNLCSMLLSMLANEGVKSFGYQQYFDKMTPPMQELLRLIATKKLVKVGRVLNGKLEADPVLRWNVGNCLTQSNNSGCIRPTKEYKGHRQKIDCFVALVFAMAAQLECRKGGMNTGF